MPPSPPQQQLALFDAPQTAVVQVTRSKKTNSLITTSMVVAQAFGKQHYHVMRDIRDLQAKLLAINDTRTLFADGFYTDTQGQRRPQMYMLEDGLNLLVMGYDGEEALRAKLAFIDEFNRLRNESASPEPQHATPAVVVSDPDQIADVAKLVSYTDVNNQRYCVKELNQYMMTLGGKGGTIYHHRETMKLLTGLRPSEYRTEMLVKKHRVASLSGRDLLRRYEPAKAAAAAVIDDAVRAGHCMKDLKLTDIGVTLTAAFNTIIGLKLLPADMPMRS